MNGIQKVLLIIALSQLGACAVMSKKECLTADWEQVGYGVGLDGNPNQTYTFNKREKACAKHGAAANWGEFQQGHSDGVVEFCQLGNAVELGADGVSRAIDQQVCPERDYPGFREAFNVGYKLHALRSDVQNSRSTISSLESRRYGYEKDLKHIRKQINSEDTDKLEHKSLRYDRRQIRDYMYDIDREIEQCRQRLYHEQSVANDYSDYVYNDYVFSLSDQFVDPRLNRKPHDKE